MNETPPGYPPPAPAAGPPAGYPPAAYPPAYAPYPQFRSPLQWKAYVRTQLDAGQPVARMLSEMGAAGVGQQDAYRLVTEIVGAMRKRALAFVVGGAIAVLVGLAVTVATMQAAQQEAESSGSGMYGMWWGPIVFGAIAAVYGLYLLGRVPKSNP